ncbi:DNA polymerase V [Enterobacter ludwigii]|uniref:DNA polymerase V n=1 Tax=Enterobacter ludwigii TaxID=299767 RepID=UPI001E59FABA|nr:DNA polymerase V [Enterobacter ludwigii]MCE1610274.1 DNA polymerase V [Enterobacter ludwigii]MCE1623570.1 DNA polymerase V [Enterobacter ludwigii]
MPRLYEIEGAFRAAVQIEPNGRRTVTTQAFVNELGKVNWRWSLRQANTWIETYVTTFRDVSDQEGEARTFQLFNPNGGL